MDFSPPIRLAGGAPMRVPLPASRGAFGFPRTPTHTHQGIDIGAPLGTPVLAVHAGVIEHAHAAPEHGFSGYGRVVVLRFVDAAEGASSGLVLHALYAHLETVQVVAGSHVRAGEKLGTVGQSQFNHLDPLDDHHMGSHLHFELARHAYPMGSEAPHRIDPRAWLELRRIPFVLGPPLAGQVTPGASMDERIRIALLAALVTTGAELQATIERIRALGAFAAPLVALGERQLAEFEAIRAELMPHLGAAPNIARARELVEAWLARRDAQNARIRPQLPPAIRPAYDEQFRAVTVRFRAALGGTELTPGATHGGWGWLVLLALAVMVLR